MDKSHFFLSGDSVCTKISYKLDPLEVYDEGILSRIEGNEEVAQYIFDVESESIVFQVSNAVSVREMLKNKLQSSQVLHIMQGLCGVFDIARLGVSIAYIAKDIDYLFINPISLDIKCLLIPVYSQNFSSEEVRGLFREVLSLISPDDSYGSTYTVELLKVINSDDFSILKLRNYLTNKVNMIAASTAAMPVVEPILEPIPEPVAPVMEPVAEPIPEPVAQVYSPIFEVKPASIPEPVKSSFENELPRTGLLNSGLNGGAMLQMMQRPVPHLVRKKTGEEIMITKSPFIIGKSKTKCDYTIQDNSAVSRVHCTVVQKDGVNYIIDNTSTNHTYLNGVEIQAGKQELLRNKMMVHLANEEFEFLLRKN